MPEMPEVEITKRILEKQLKFLKICKIQIFKKELRWIIKNELKKLFLDCIILKPFRLGKYIIIPTNKNICLIIHLGMSGVLKIKIKNEKLEKHDHVKFTMLDENEKKSYLIYNDPRRFGLIDYCYKNKLKYHFLLKNLGIEALSKGLNSDYLLKKFKNKNISIKIALLDQKIIAGIGNIYASEILFLSKTHPLFNVKFIDVNQAIKICKSIKLILTRAIKKGGTTIKDFKNPDGKLGYFKQQLLVYSREGKKCFVCTKIIKMINFGGRATFYCESCQKSSKEFLKEI